MAMDTFYISHGSPTLSIDESLPARRFLQSWGPAGRAGPKPPRAILVVSGHWETDTPAVNVIRFTNDTIYDFYGFPAQMYKLTYPEPGAPAVADKTKHLLEDAGFGPVKEDHRRRLDHGAWVPLMLMYPDANVPVCQLSVQTDRDATYHYDLGRALAPLREDGVLIVGSGSATHSLRRILRTFAPTSHEPPPAWAAERRRRTRTWRTRGPTTSTRCTSRSAPPGKGARPSSSTAAGPTPRCPMPRIASPPKTEADGFATYADTDSSAAPAATCCK